MTEESSEDWLPPGWTVEVRVRKHGKRDKYYFAPSSGLRFNSRAEVSRYLNTQEVCNSKPEQKIQDTQEVCNTKPEQKIKDTQEVCNPKPEQKIKDTLKRSAKNVVVEKAIAEGLPPGWIKEIRVTKKGHKIRRDPFYTDPVSGYIFHSMKDALRYVETGELGRLASKPKDNGSTDVELEDDNIASLAVAKKQKSALSSTREEIICDQSSKWDVMVKDEPMLKPSCTEKCVPLSEHTSDQCRLDTDLNSSNLPETKVSEQIEGKNDSAKSVFVSAPAVELHPANQSLKSKETMHENEKTQLDMRKSKSKKEYNLPRRASKRLAGLDIDPTPELKTSRARRFGKQPGEAGASTPPSSSPGSLAHWASLEPAQLEAGMEAESKFDSSKNTKVLVESINCKHTSADMTTPGGHAGKIQEENKDEKKPKSSVVLPVENLSISEELSGRIGKGNEENEKPDIPVDLPSMDLWSDPCIQFAIKTLTGEGIDRPKSTELSSVSNNSQLATGDLATSASPDKTKMEETENKGDKKQGCSVVLPVPEEHARKVENNYRDYEKPGSPLNMAFSDSWMDPCIEFAVKTLTGAIPVDCVLDIQDSFHSQQSSSQTQASSGLTSSTVGYNKFCQTDFLGKKIDTLEMPNYRHQALVEPVLPQTGNVSLQNSATTVLRRQSEGRGDRCQ
ncbi:methyl-CpG-binding domain-containing protein 13 isoform X2 [Corylus avellana]|uniref:methyl-CpG-binding domain-containing protein 13 isoform X2 n=1 Tax=Corylus avellana TaxID=13451 RepID=UPI00286C220C|nr:methyl-CpG-binding domain-containing protein 13 isoform X2 [Corylus avellana]